MAESSSAALPVDHFHTALQQIPVVGGAVLVRCPDNSDGAPPKTYLINYLTGSSMPPHQPVVEKDKPVKKVNKRKKTQREIDDKDDIEAKSKLSSLQTSALQRVNDNAATATSSAETKPQSHPGNDSVAKVGVISRMQTRSLGKKVAACSAKNLVEISEDKISKTSKLRVKNQSDIDNSALNPLRKAQKKQTKNVKSKVLSHQSYAKHSPKEVSKQATLVTKAVKVKPGQNEKFRKKQGNCRKTSRNPNETEHAKPKTSFKNIKPYLKIEDVVKAMTKVPAPPSAQSSGNNEGDRTDKFKNVGDKDVDSFRATDVSRTNVAKEKNQNEIKPQKIIRLPLLTKANFEQEDILIEVEIEHGLFVGPFSREILQNGNSRCHFRVSNDSFAEADKHSNDISDPVEEPGIEMQTGDASPIHSKDTRRENEEEFSCQVELAHTPQEITANNGNVNNREVEHTELTSELEVINLPNEERTMKDIRQETSTKQNVLDNVENTSVACIVTDETSSLVTDGAVMQSNNDGDLRTVINIDVKKETITDVPAEGLTISTDNLASILSTDSKDPCFTVPKKRLRGVLEEDLKDTETELSSNKKRKYFKVDKPQPDFDYKVKIAENGKRLYVCNICGHEAKGNMSSHFRMHNGEKPYQCSMCGKAFSNKSNFNKHKLTHTSARPFVCDVCGYTFKCRTHLRLHSERHFTVGKHMCQFCGKCFHTFRELDAHMQMHDKVPMFECKVCKKKFQHKHAQMRHENSHVSSGLFQCHLCGATFSRADNYRLHLRKKHMDGLLNDPVMKNSTPAWKRNIKSNTQQEVDSKEYVLKVETQAEPEAQAVVVSEVNDETGVTSDEVQQIVYIDGATEIPHVVQEVEVELATHELASLLMGFHKPQDM